MFLGWVLYAGQDSSQELVPTTVPSIGVNVTEMKPEIRMGKRDGDGELMQQPGHTRASAGAAEIPSPAIKLETAFDASRAAEDSIQDLKFTLVLTICLVVLVIFLSLRNITATLIPGVAVPLSIVGTFAAMYLLGYSLNNLSLMALTLSVGFRRGRCHRHAGEHRAAHGIGRDENARRYGIKGDWLHDRDYLLVPVFIPVHGWHHRPLQPCSCPAASQSR